MHLTIKRVYEPHSPGDGFRVLVDRLWPRGVSKPEAHIDLWSKDVAPSTELRHWFNHETDKWPEFQRRYRAELDHNPEAVRALRLAVHGKQKVTLLYGAKDELHNQAVVLQTYLPGGGS